MACAWRHRNWSSLQLVQYREVREFLPDAVIAVVDNGSSDNTAEVALQENVMVWHEPLKGKDYAIRYGLVRIPANCDTVFITDGDDTYAAAPVIEALELVRTAGYDMIVGRRESSFISGTR